jgi:Tfp pilus assembly ATPase PilU
MRTLDQSLVSLYLEGIISGESLINLCNDKNEIWKLAGQVMA